jgi:hypothetical protein
MTRYITTAIVKTNEIQNDGYKVLKEHYLHNAACTRAECKEWGINQLKWRAINQLLKEIKIKNKRSWIDIPFGQAVEAWDHACLNNREITFQWRGKHD